jgi:hypothetical protein
MSARHAGRLNVGWPGDGDMKLYYAPGTISLMPHAALLESGLRFVAVILLKPNMPIQRALPFDAHRT